MAKAHKFWGAFLLFLTCLSSPACSSKSETKQKKEYTIGLDTSSYQFYREENKTKLKGFLDELTNLISQESGLSLSILSVSGIEVTKGFNEKAFDACITAINPSGATQDLYDFSHVFLLIGPVLVVKADASQVTIADLSGKFVGITEDDFSKQLLSTYRLSFKNYENLNLAFSALEKGEIDAGLFDALSAYSYTKSLSTPKFKIASEPLTSDGFRLIAPKNSALNLLTTFNQSLTKLQESGQYQSLLKTWGFSP